MSTPFRTAVGDAETRQSLERIAIRFTEVDSVMGASSNVDYLLLTATYLGASLPYARQLTAASPLALSGAGALSLGTVPIGQGGTGATTALTAFNALSPTTTVGDLIVRGPTNNERLGRGANGYVLTSIASDGNKIAYAQLTGSGGGIVIDSTSTPYAHIFRVSADESSLTLDVVNEWLQIKDLGVTSAKLANLAVSTGKIAADAVTFPKMRNAAANSVLVGAGSAGTGIDYAEISLGTGLSMSGTVLSSSGLGDHDHTAGGDGGILTNDLHDGFLGLLNISTPANPAAGRMQVFTRLSGDSIELVSQGPLGGECILCSKPNVNAGAEMPLNWVEEP